MTITAGLTAPPYGTGSWAKGPGLNLCGTEPKPFKRKGTFSGAMYQLTTTLATKEAEELSPERWVTCGPREQSG